VNVRALTESDTIGCKATYEVRANPPSSFKVPYSEFATYKKLIVNHWDVLFYYAPTSTTNLCPITSCSIETTDSS
jgi:hypothetical protein